MTDATAFTYLRDQYNTGRWDDDPVFTDALAIVLEVLADASGIEY